jgi:hypothetical protein
MTESKEKVPTFLKASVFAMGIVFVVLLVVLVFLSQKKHKEKKVSCSEFLQIKIGAPIADMQLQRGNIIVLTKMNEATNKQEIIKINSNCNKIINRVEFSK